MMIVGPMNKGRPFLGIFSARASTAAFAVALVLLTSQVRGFSLLGPYADWMDVTNAFRQPDDIGGPMDIKEGYRAILFTCIKKAAVAPRSRKEHLLNYWLALEKYSKPPE